MLMIWVVILLLLIIYLYKVSRKPNGFPPGPARLPFVGFIPFMDPQKLHKQLFEMQVQYGPIIGLYLGSIRLVAVNGWEAVKDALVNEDLDGRPASVFDKLLRNDKAVGIINRDGQKWKVHRRFALKHFRELGFGKNTHEEIIHDELQQLIEDINVTKGGVVIQDLIGTSAINILWAVVGGERLPRSDSRLRQIVKDVDDVFRGGNLCGGILQLAPFLAQLAPELTGFARANRGFSGIQNFVETAIKEHKDTYDSSNSRDFLDMYIREMKENPDRDESFTEEQLAGLVVDVFMAGVETGTSLMSFAVLFVCLHQEMQVKLHQELDHVVGQQRMPSSNDRQSLPYCEAVLTEVMRIRSPAPLTVPHRATKDTSLQGHFIPKDTMILINLYSIMMEEAQWGDPCVFRPERFLNEEGKFIKDERVLIFGRGKRICLGESLARMSSFNLFCGLLHKFSFRFFPGEEPKELDGKPGFTLGPPDYKVLATSRF